VKVWIRNSTGPFGWKVTAEREDGSAVEIPCSSLWLNVESRGGGGGKLILEIPWHLVRADAVVREVVGRIEREP
jgi:hypothetical protein